jgi:hypothetical protein
MRRSLPLGAISEKHVTTHFPTGELLRIDLLSYLLSLGQVLVIYQAPTLLPVRGLPLRFRRR